MLHTSIERRWGGATVVCAATGPSLSAGQVQHCREVPTIAVSDAYKLMPWADVLYSCDTRWWDVHGPRALAAGVTSQRWSCHEAGKNDKRAAAAQHGLHLVPGVRGSVFEPAGFIRYGNNSGFQAINLAILFGAARVLLIGYDMRGTHFFGRHERPLVNTDPGQFIQEFNTAAKKLPPGVEVVNCTPGSALRCFPAAALQDALRHNDGHGAQASQV